MGKITNLSQGKHGFHVHEKGELGNQCKDAGGHYNPHNKQHGGLAADMRHEGDFGNIVADEKKTAKISITSKNTDLNKQHGGLAADMRHEGDFGNIVADEKKTAKISIT